MNQTILTLVVGKIEQTEGPADLHKFDRRIRPLKPHLMDRHSK